jgi:hypothetical protein
VKDTITVIDIFSIINERKNHANFQLIIITHDENFLRKLGQSDVMEYYWYVAKHYSYAAADLLQQACVKRFASEICH